MIRIGGEANNGQIKDRIAIKEYVAEAIGEDYRSHRSDGKQIHKWDKDTKCRCHH